jgi:hypothetical protein
MMLAFVFNLALVKGSFVFSGLLLLQILLYGLGVLGVLRPKLQELIMVKIPTYFLAVNVSILFAWWRYLSGQRIITWTPTRR